MRSKFLAKDPLRLQFGIFGLVLIGAIFLSLATQWYFLLALPVGLMIAYLTLVDFRLVYYILLACIPISTEIVLPNGFGTDLPTEPLVIGLMFVFILFVVSEGKNLSTAFLTHPVSILLLVHVFWIFLTTITSDLFWVSIKFSLAKIWYVVVFYFMAGYIFKTKKDVQRLFCFVFIPLILTILITLVRHSTFGFSFKDVHKVLHPFQRNHVNYAASLSLFFPLIWYTTLDWFKKRSVHWYLLVLAQIVFFIAIYLSFTRTAYVALGIAIGAYFIVRLKLMRYVILLSVVGGLIAVGLMANKNKYLAYAPNFDRTITHYEFDNLLEATYKMEDISTMERVYRWVAGFQMSIEKPWLGFGPGNFVNFYKSYTVKSFRTYVSNNKEKSGIHSYFLMTLVEQGIPGLLIFIFFNIAILLYGERTYHRTRSQSDKRIVMMVLLALVVVDAFLIINDMIETDKVGSFFFIFAAIIVNWDLKQASQLNSQKNKQKTPQKAGENIS